MFARRPSLALLCLLSLAWLAPAEAYHKIIVVDKSGSMSDAAPNDPAETPKYDQVVKLVLEEVALDLAGGGNKVTLVFFDRYVTGLRQVGSIADARRALQAFPPGGQTNIGDTLDFVLKLIQRDSNERYFVVSLYTDGEEALTDPASQGTTMEEAKRKFIAHLGGLKTRTFISFFNKRWNSKENKDFSRLLKEIQKATENNPHLELIIEEELDPSMRSRFVGVIFRLGSEKLLLEQPRDAKVAEVDLEISSRGTQKAVANKLTYVLKPRLVGADAKLQLEPSRIVIDRAVKTTRHKIVIGGLDKLDKHKPYELELTPVLVKDNLDNLFKSDLEQRKLILRQLPTRLYTHFVLAPTPTFELISPRGGQLSAELKPGRVFYQEMELRWNKTAVGQRVTLSLDPKLAPAVRLVSHPDRRPRAIGSFKLPSTLRARYFVRVQLPGTGNLAGELTITGRGKLKGVDRKLSIQLTEKSGQLQVLFPDRGERKVFPGVPLTMPVAVQIKPDPDAVGESYVLKTEAPEGVTFELTDAFDRSVLGKEQFVDTAQLRTYGLRLKIEPGVDLSTLADELKIHIRPAKPGRLKLVDARGEPTGDKPFPLPISLAAPKRELAAQLKAPAELLVHKGTGRAEVAIQLAWSADANRQQFDVELTPELLGGDRGAPKKGLAWRWAGGSSSPRSLKLGKQQATQQSHRLELRCEAGAPKGDWLLRVRVKTTGLGEGDGERFLELPVRVVSGEARVAFVPSDQRLQAGVAGPLGELVIQPTNPHAEGRSLKVALTPSAGVELELRRDGEAIEAGDWKLGSVPLRVKLRATAGYKALIDGAPVVNLKVSRQPGVELRYDGKLINELRIPIEVPLIRPRLVHMRGEDMSAELDLGRKPVGSEAATPPEGSLRLDALDAPEAISEALGEETVKLEWIQDETQGHISAVTFAVSGKDTATIAQLREDARFVISFKDPDKVHGWFAPTPVYAIVTLSSEAPAELVNPELKLRVEVEPRLKPLALAGIGGGLLLLLIVALRALGGGGAARALAGALELSGAAPLTLDGFERAYLRLEGGRLQLSPEAAGAAARLDATARGAKLTATGEATVAVGGAPVEKSAELYDGVSLQVGEVRAVYRARSGEVRRSEAVDLSAPAAGAAAAADDGPGISLDAPAPAAPAAAPEPAAEAAAPPPPPADDDDEDGITL